MITIELTHVLRMRGPSGVETIPVDALAIGTDGGRRLFVPGVLPCGDCGPCRRGLVGVCRSPNHWMRDADPTPLPGMRLEVPERFVHDLDLMQIEPAPLPQQAVCAGLGARILEAAGRAGLGPGQIAVWAGPGPLPDLGAGWATARGCTSLRVPDLSEQAFAEAQPKISAAMQAAPTGFVESVLFAIFDPALSALGGRPLVDPSWLQPGTTVVALPLPGVSGPESDHVQIPLQVGCRAVRLGAWPHPDFVPESLAAIARSELDCSGLMLEGKPFGFVVTS